MSLLILETLWVVLVDSYTESPLLDFFTFLLDTICRLIFCQAFGASYFMTSPCNRCIPNKNKSQKRICTLTPPRTNISPEKRQLEANLFLLKKIVPFDMAYFQVPNRRYQSLHFLGKWIPEHPPHTSGRLDHEIWNNAMELAALAFTPPLNKTNKKGVNWNTTKILGELQEFKEGEWDL